MTTIFVAKLQDLPQTFFEIPATTSAMFDCAQAHKTSVTTQSAHEQRYYWYQSVINQVTFGERESDVNV